LPEGSEPSPRRIATVLSAIFAFQIVAMLVIVAGGIALMVTFAHNNSLDCSPVGFASGGACTKRSYALAIGLLAGGFGMFLAAMVASATYALRHVGAPVLGALQARRRLWEQRAGQQPPAGS
jgi:hypothetical protein